MGLLFQPITALLRRLFSRVDAVTNRWYGSRYNPLYQSGTIVTALFLVLIGSGLWLLFFYHISAPWASVAAITAAPWSGNWVRGLHRYASDAAVIATLVHAIRMFGQGRSWGPRALAWVSGVVMLGLVLILGWTGYVMVWDTFGQALARQGARLLDVLPILSEPIGRAFVGERPIPGAFFFLNLFVHVALPLSLGLVLWLHVSRMARPTLLPPKRLTWGMIGLLLLYAVVRPIAIAPEASPFTIPATIPLDGIYAFWLPWSSHVSPGMTWLALGLVMLFLVLVPRFTRPAAAKILPPSFIDPEICTGCTQCSLDCPWEAITMVRRAEGDTRSELVGLVDPALCVSCGICAGSCAPMGVGPPGRTGRDQISDVRAFIAAPERRAGEIVAITCNAGAGQFSAVLQSAGAVTYPIHCAGDLHSSVVEFLLRAGAGGVLVYSCPPRDCVNREGPRWLDARLFHDREAELQARVDKRRVAIAHVAAGEVALALAAYRDFEAKIQALDAVIAEQAIDIERVCEPDEITAPAGDQ